LLVSPAPEKNEKEIFCGSSFLSAQPIFILVSPAPEKNEKEIFCGSSFLSTQPIFIIQANVYYPSYHSSGNGSEK